MFMLLATVSWAFYSWLLVRTSEPASVRGDWAAFLMAQMVFGLLWSGGFAGAEWALAPSHITWGWPLVAALAFIAIGPPWWPTAAGVSVCAACGASDCGVLLQPHTAVCC
jgi:hypothetical protein